MDMILLIMLSAFVFYRLWNVLGTRTGNEKRRDWNTTTKGTESSGAETDNIIVLPQRKMRMADIIDDEKPTPFANELKTLMEYDHSFSTDAFLRGATRAFNHIVNAYADGNHTKLKKLLSADVYEKFAAAIETRRERNEQLEVEIESIEADISDIKITDSAVVITVTFESEQMLATVDADGQSFDNPARLKAKTHDVWTFERPLDDTSQLWLLVKTESKQS